MDRLSPEMAAFVLEFMKTPAASDALRSSGVDLARFGQKRTNAELMRLHEKTLAQMRRAQMQGSIQIGTTNPFANVKPAGAFASPCIPADLTPIYASALTAGVTHRGRALRAKIVGAPCVMVAAQMLLEDDRGDYVKIAVYNRVRDQAEADALFVLGRRLLVLEPYFKVMADGTQGIRCDNPNEVILLPLDEPAPAGAQNAMAAAEARKAEGNRHFAAVQLEEAVTSYTRGLDELDSQASGRMLALCCLNSSACHLKLGQPLSALEAAIATLALLAADEHAPPRPELGKALVRAGLAAAGLSASAAARWALVEAARVTGAADGGAKLLAQIGEHPAASSSASTPASAAHQPEADGLGLLLRALHVGGGSAEPMLTLPADTAEPPADSGELGHTRAAESKARGNEFFAAGDFAAALASYEKAVRELGRAPLAATLLANRAASFLRVGTRSARLSALRDARAALAISRDELQPKARHRVALALVALEWLPEAEAACDAAIRVLAEEQTAIFVELRANIVARRAATSAQQQAQQQRAPGSQPRASVHERLRTALEAEGGRDTCSPEALQGAREMISMMSRIAGGDAMLQDMLLFEGPFYDTRVAPFHQEFFRAGLMPTQCDVARCMSKLLAAYEHAASMRLWEVYIVHGCQPSSESGRSGADAPFCDGLFVTRGDVFKRLRSFEEADIHWLFTAQNGSVREASVSPYENELHHSFSNAAVMPTVMDAGRTHVAVGFVDLATLSASIAISGYCEESASQPTRWVGYEQSAYAVAKTAVIIAMMQRGASDDDVMQVWYSAAWSLGTRASFRAALRDLLSPACARVTGGLDGSTIPSAVLAFLRHWSLADVSLAAAREGWLDRQGSPLSFIGNFKRARDRHSLCAYVLTGQLLTAEVGSAVMFGMPEELGVVSPGESFLQTIPFFELAKAHSNATCDVVETCVRIVRSRIAALSHQMRRGAVCVQLSLATLTPEASALHAEIRALQPHTLNWSNVPDYVTPKAFHKMARACSAAEDTVHVMHTMNWPLYTHGSSHIDFALRLKPTGVQSEFRKVVAAAHDSVDMLYRVTGFDKVALAPPNTDVRNMLDLVFMNLTYRQCANAFLAHGDFANEHRQTMIHTAPIFSVLSRSNSTFVVAFSYDPTMTLTANARTTMNVHH